MSPSVPRLLSLVDGAGAGAVLRNRRPLLQRAWTQTMATCWGRSSAVAAAAVAAPGAAPGAAGQRQDITEAVLAAPLTEMVTGCGCRLKPGQYQVMRHTWMSHMHDSCSTKQPGQYTEYTLRAAQEESRYI